MHFTFFEGLNPPNLPALIGAAPRFHHQWLPDEIKVEPTAVATSERKKLWEMGHQLKEVERMAVMKAIQVLPDGRLNGAGDARDTVNDGGGGVVIDRFKIIGTIDIA